MRTTWAETLLFCGPYPVAHKRFYKLETLRNAIEKGLAERDRFLYAGIQSQLGDVPLGAVSFDLIYEDAARLTYRVQASNRARKRVALRLVAAKNHEEHSAHILEEYETLKVLHERAPDSVPAPCAHGVIFLPDRHKRREVNREVFAYIARDVAGAAPLYVASGTQLAPHDLKPRRFSVRESEALKAALVRMIAGMYDENTTTGFDPAVLYPECLTAAKDTTGAPVLFLVQGRRMRRRFRPHTLIHNLLFSVLKSDVHVFPLAPARPEEFLDGLCAAVGADRACAWCRSFLSKSATMQSHAHEELLPGREYLAALASLVEDR